LRVEIEQFLAAISESGEGGERRAYQRFTADLQLQVALRGSIVPARLIDVSLGGCALAVALGAACGERVRVLTATGAAIPARVVAVGDDGTRLQFALDVTTRQTVQALLETTARRALAA
jgi:hypothetical protein